MTGLLPLAAALVLAAGMPGSARAERPPGGPELVVVPTPGARTASLRIVVRAGSAQDPFAMAGAAHLLEHLLIRDPGRPAVELLGDARAAGARVNGHTSRAATWFTLDAPADAFRPLAARLLRGVTNPRFDQKAVDREREIIQREQSEVDEGASLLDSALFPIGPPETTILGDGSSRGQIARSDILEYFQRNYAASTMTVVMTGAVTPKQARALLDEAFLLPPALPGEGPVSSDAEPSLPADLKLRAPFIAAVYGYRLDAADRARCEPLAALLELRLLEKLTLEEPILRTIEAGCYGVRGNEFLLVFAYAPTLDASNLSSNFEWAFASVLRQRLEGAERQGLERRLDRLATARDSDPAALADAIVVEALRRRAPGAAPLPPPAARLDEEALRAVARRAFKPERRVLLLLSPFEG